MLERLIGEIIIHTERSVTVLVGGVGYLVSVPHSALFTNGKTACLYLSSQWSAEKGPVLYGFGEEYERSVFELIISCPKIGPSVALSLIGTLGADQCMNALATQNIKVLSTAPGVGAKKAEHIAVLLRDKIQDMGVRVASPQNDQWYALTQALQSLGYSPREITGAVQKLRESVDSSVLLDNLIRKALVILSTRE